MADNSPIIIRKIIEEEGHGHHGGAWKVAYADFVTAMMAFFLMLWLLSTADEQQLKGLAEYFSDAAENQSQPGGMGGVLDGISFVTPDMAVQAPVSPFAPSSLPLTATPEEADPDDFALDLALAFGLDDAADAAARRPLDDEAFAEERRRREQAAFDEARAAMLNALSQRPELARFTDSLIIDDTPEGLRIQIVDREQNAMFPTASAEMLANAQALIALVAEAIGDLPNRLSIRGHTDARPFARGAAYDNWRLSADRANATREALIEAGVAASRVADIIGKGPSEPLFPDDPLDARNRRISLVLLRDATGSAAGGSTSGDPPGNGAPDRG